MTAGQRLIVCLFVIVNHINFSLSCGDEDVAVYKVILHGLWSEETFPKDYPSNRPKAQWSQVFGQSHNRSYALYRVGEEAKQSVRDFAQFGKLDVLVEEGDDEPKVYDQFSAPAIGRGVGETENLVFVEYDHSLVSLIWRMIPSPDWFVGVDSVDLCVDENWIDQITLELEPLDAGAASGLTFTAPRWETKPPEAVTRHQPRRPNHPAAGFYYPTLKELPAIARVEFIKIKEYSTIELNKLAKKNLLNALRPTVNETPKAAAEDNYLNEEITTKSTLDRLKDLEEDPVGTPLPNLPGNNVIVITSTVKPPTGDEEFDSHLKNMDEVVLAVARGKRMGLGKHLPRHFRSRLHHAVNKIQPNDCLVSEWSEWTACSVTCGFGNKYRYRSVVRERIGDGRECPQLADREHCGDVNSCTHIDYFEW